ncbi:DUF6583 family protein [Sediminibacillus albus]|uniref:Uncharacterized protein n=1 Tax=Sediminibacillus albus TaxID=407036 RepID=A0A1G8Y3M7_9BACI|nr:DUF6583 family protein [Sediminibacillus albus]SDJ97438.1 hypothetical protein SAMN05216243_1388 [Sediminibacillus albus]
MKKLSKKTIWIIALAVVIVIGGSISASALLKKSPKEQYFSAELNSFNLMKDIVKDRYSDEFAWNEATKEKPSESTIEFSAEYNDPSGYDMTGMSDLINNATITLKNDLDPKKKEMSLEASANIAELSVDGVQFYLTSEKAMLTLPFLNEFLQVKESNVGNLLYQADPYAFTGDEEIEFDKFFNQTLISEDHLTHLQDTYLKMIYEELPDDAFVSADEKVDVDGKTIDAAKITLSLSEDQVKKLIEKVLTTAENDDQLKEIIKEQASLDPVTYNSEDVATMIEHFDESIKEAKQDLKDLQVPEGLTSTLWVQDDLVVKRDFSVEMGIDGMEPAALTVAGTQSLAKETQAFDYEFAFKDGYSEESVNLTGDLSWKDNKADDQITISVANSGLELSYTGTEELTDGTRDFDRKFTFSDPSSMAAYQLIWVGQSTYEKDQMNAEYHLAFEGDGLSQDIFQMNMDMDSKLVKSLDIDTDSMEVVDLGTMNAEEMETYYLEDVMPQLQEWMMEFYGAFYNSDMGY